MSKVRKFDKMFTRESFLKELGSLKKRWTVKENGELRCRVDKMDTCPICAVINYPGGDVSEAQAASGGQLFRSTLADEIMCAADHPLAFYDDLLPYHATEREKHSLKRKRQLRLDMFKAVGLPPV